MSLNQVTVNYIITTSVTKRNNQHFIPVFNPLHATGCLDQLDVDHLAQQLSTDRKWKCDIPLFTEKNRLSQNWYLWAPDDTLRSVAGFSVQDNYLQAAVAFLVGSSVAGTGNQRTKYISFLFKKKWAQKRILHVKFCFWIHIFIITLNYIFWFCLPNDGCCLHFQCSQFIHLYFHLNYVHM